MKCPKCKKGKMVDDKSSLGILIRCKLCNIHLVNLDNPYVPSKDLTPEQRKVLIKWDGI